MENKTPLQKAFRDYLNNRYYISQLLAITFVIIGICTIDEFENLFTKIILFSICCAVILIPFVFVLIWANDYKKGIRK